MEKNQLPDMTRENKDKFFSEETIAEELKREVIAAAFADREQERIDHITRSDMAINGLQTVVEASIRLESVASMIDRANEDYSRFRRVLPKACAIPDCVEHSIALKRVIENSSLTANEPIKHLIVSIYKRLRLFACNREKYRGQGRDDWQTDHEGAEEAYKPKGALAQEKKNGERDWRVQQVFTPDLWRRGYWKELSQTDFFLAWKDYLEQFLKIAGIDIAAQPAANVPHSSTVSPQGSTVEAAGQYPTADRVVPCSPDVREVINRIFKGNEGLALEFLKKAQEFPSAPFIARQLCRLQKEEKIRYFSIHGDKKRFYSWLKANKALEGNRVNFTKRLIDKGVR